MLGTIDFEKLNKFVGEKALRNYQYLLLSGRGLYCENGREIKPVYTFIDNDFIAYLMNDVNRTWIICKSIQFGYPVIETRDFYLEKEVNKNTEKPLDKIDTEKNVKRLRNIINFDELSKLEVSSHKPALYFGHLNFAHVIWNELPALLEFVKLSNSGFEVKYRHDPLKILQDIDGLYPQYLENDNFISDTATHVRVGGCYINQKTIEFLKSFVPIVSRNKRFTIWITVRNDGRTCINQSEFIENLVRYLVEAIGKPVTVIFDGFNYPCDFSSRAYDSRRKIFVERESSICRYIEELIHELSCVQEIQNQDVTFSHTGSMSILECLGLTKLVDYYVAHIGSIQHKVSWIFNPPGFVHGNSISITEGAKKWLDNLTQNEGRTKFISDKYIKDIDSIRLESVVDRNKDYEIVYDDELFAEIYEHLCLSCKE